MCPDVTQEYQLWFPWSSEHSQALTPWSFPKVSGAEGGKAAFSHHDSVKCHKSHPLVPPEAPVSVSSSTPDSLDSPSFTPGPDWGLSASSNLLSNPHLFQGNCKQRHRPWAPTGRLVQARYKPAASCQRAWAPGALCPLRCCLCLTVICLSLIMPRLCPHSIPQVFTTYPMC